MPRKPALLLSLLNLVLRPIASQTSASSKRLVALPQWPPAHDREAWCAYWKARGQPWRTEPEIDVKRQKYLSARRAISPNIQQGIYPFKNIKLGRSDVEWLLATHENGRGPVDWSDERQRGRDGLDLRGVDLCQVELCNLPLARLIAGLAPEERVGVTDVQRNMSATFMEGADLYKAHLEGANLYKVNLKNAHLSRAQFRETYFYRTCLESANLRFAHLEDAYFYRTVLKEANFEGVFLSNDKHIGPYLLDINWNDVNIAVVNWTQIRMLRNEHEARQKRVHGRAKNKAVRFEEYIKAARANRQLANALQSQGLNEDAARFAYRAQVLQKTIFRFQVLQSSITLRHRVQLLGAWLFSWFLFLIAGYGYRLWRSFLAYILVIIGFTTVYYLLGASFKPPLSLVNALGLSMTSFHGRGFFPGVTQLNDPLTILASIEAFVGLILEATFIATLTQRFFGK